MKSCFARLKKADLISSEAARRRFHPSKLGFHPAEQDFIEFTRLVRMLFFLASFFVFTRKIQIVHFIPLLFNLWGIVQFLIHLIKILVWIIRCSFFNRYSSNNHFQNY